MSFKNFSMRTAENKPKINEVLTALWGIEAVSNLALPVAAIGAAVGAFLGPGYFIASSLIGAFSLLAKRNLIKGKKKLINDMREAAKHREISVEEYNKVVEKVNRLTIEGPLEPSSNVPKLPRGSQHMAATH